MTSISDLAVGQKVRLSDNRYGTVRFVGQTAFAPGDWVGLELDDGSGKNDGSVQGERYFECRMGAGMFVRPGTIAVISQPAQPAQPKAAVPKKLTRPGGLFTAATSRASNPADTTLAKRKSLNAPSPTPAPRPSRSSSIARSPTRSPTKQLATPASSTLASRTNTPSNTKPVLGVRPRPSIAPGRPSMAPPPLPGQRARQVSAVTAVHPKPAGAPARALSGRLSTTGAKHGAATRVRSSDSQSGVAPAGPTGKRGSGSTVSTQRSSDDEIIAPKPTRPTQQRTLALEQLVGSPYITPPAPSATSAATATSTGAAVNKEIEDLKAKLRVLEKKRMEDREKINTLDQVKADRDKFERIIQTLQMRYQPAKQENIELRRQLQEAEARLGTIEDIQAEHDSALELATLDREMAEEMAEVYKAELEALKLRSEELELEVEVLREENAEFAKGMSPEDMASATWLQMEKSNERYREALIRLRELSQETEEELKARIKGLEESLHELEGASEQSAAFKEDLAQKESTIEDLREQLNNALGAEDMIESLTEQNMNQSEEIRELKAAIAALEDLKEVNDELEIQHVQYEKDMQEEIYQKEAMIAEQIRLAAQQQTSIEDLEYTLSRFRELVTSLQSDLADMRASQAVTENESEQLNSRSRAMLDLNMKLQISAAKAQAKTIDLELRRMEALEAEKHLEIVTLFLPDSYQTDRDSVLALLRFKRLAFKANLLNGFIKERVNGQPHPGHEDEVFEGCGAAEKLTWVACMCERFANAISHCSLEQFTKYQGALWELEPAERAMNGWIDGLRRNELKEKQCAVELQRTIALMTHLGEVHISADLQSFADDIYMRAQLTQGYLESAAVAFTTAKAMVQRMIPSTEDEEELSQYFSNRIESAVTQTRSVKVVAGKIVRALEDLNTRSLSLLPDCLEAFELCEVSANELAVMARRIGLDLHQLLNEEGRTDPCSYAEVQSCIQNTVLTAFESSESDMLSTYFNNLRAVTSQVSDLAALSTDLTQTQEFERGPAPWTLRSQELKELKKVPLEAEAELRRLKEDYATARRAVAIREEDLSTAQVKIETLEARMRDAKAKAARIAELEAQIESGKTEIATLADNIAKQDRELKALELDRDRWKTVASSSSASRAVSAEGEHGSAGANASAKDSRDRAVATQRELDTLKSTVAGLEAALRYLREDNRRARMTEQPSHDWLAEPLAKPAKPAEQRRAVAWSEGRAVLKELVNLSSTAKVYDLAKLPEDRVKWKPARTTPQWHAARQREEFEAWRGWQVAAVRRGRGVIGVR